MMTSPHFLNVDLEIESKSDLQPLSQELGNEILVLYQGKAKQHFRLYFEISGLVTGASAKQTDQTIIALCSLIEGLSPEGRHLWATATRREFDIGYEERLSSDHFNHFNHFLISPVTIQRIANLNASLAVTIYKEMTSEDLWSLTLPARGRSPMVDDKSLLEFPFGSCLPILTALDGLTETHLHEKDPQRGYSIAEETGQLGICHRTHSAGDSRRG